jgi:nitrite reductase/ring-hydroxylating ferredoxin subunit
MAEHELGRADEFEEGSKRLVSFSGVDIGVFRLDGQFYAWQNVCPHQGGPVCQGRIFKRVVDNLGPDKQHHGRAYDDGELHIVCPWHGGEFNIRTGRHAGIPDLRLNPIEVEIRNGKVVVRVE